MGRNSRISSRGSEINREKKILEAEAALNANGEGEIIEEPTEMASDMLMEDLQYMNEEIRGIRALWNSCSLFEKCVRPGLYTLGGGHLASRHPPQQTP